MPRVTQLVSGEIKIKPGFDFRLKLLTTVHVCTFYLPTTVGWSRGSAGVTYGVYTLNVYLIDH